MKTRSNKSKERNHCKIESFAHTTMFTTNNVAIEPIKESIKEKEED